MADPISSIPGPARPPLAPGDAGQQPVNAPRDGRGAATVGLPARTADLRENLILGRVYELGKWSTETFGHNPTASAAVTAAPLPLALAGVQGATRGAASRIGSSITSLLPSSALTGELIKSNLRSVGAVVATGAGKVLDGATGVLSLAEAFRTDIDSGDVALTHTAKATVKSVFQIGGTAAATALVGTAVVGVSSVAAVPIAIGAAAGIGAGWAIGKLYDYVVD